MALSLIVCGIAIICLQGFRWYKMGEARMENEHTDTVVPLDSIVNPQPGVKVYKRVKRQVTYRRGSFPFINKTVDPQGVEYYSEVDK